MYAVHMCKVTHACRHAIMPFDSAKVTQYVKAGRWSVHVHQDTCMSAIRSTGATTFGAGPTACMQDGSSRCSSVTLCMLSLTTQHPSQLAGAVAVAAAAADAAAAGCLPLPLRALQL